MSPHEVAVLLDKLCIKLGFCLPPAQRDELMHAPPSDVEAFTRAVIVAEGLQPDFMGRHLYRRVREMVKEAFDGAK